MKLVIFTIISLLLAACGQREALVDVDLTLSPYIANYEKFGCGRRPIEFTASVTFGVAGTSDRGNPSTGRCDRLLTATGYQNRVVIDRGAWDRIPESRRQVVVIHELLHCELGLRHVTDKTDWMHNTTIESSKDEYFEKNVRKYCEKGVNK